VFSSTVLDVIVGLIFGFLSVSLVTSAIVEAMNSLFKLRSRSLRSGIKQLVNDHGFQALALQLYQHASISPRGPGAAGNAKTRSPAYIDPKQFASALLDITGLSAASVSVADPGPDAVTTLLKAIPATTDPQVKSLLEGVTRRAKGDLDKIHAELAHWFDSSMDRVGGAFKRWTQFASFIVALALAVVINVDTLRIARGMWEQPVIAERLKQFLPAQGTPSNGGGAQSTPQPSPTKDVIETLEGNLPVGWPNGNILQVQDTDKKFYWLWHGDNWWTVVAGWLITAMAALFGAPFWFDALQTVIRLKGSGPSPQEKVSGGAASS
jgi:hypothetical protein